MNRDTVYADFVEFLASATDRPAEEITGRSDLFDDLDMDSLSMLEVIVFLEDRCEADVEVAMREAVDDPDSPLRRVDGVVDLVMSLRSETAGV